MSVDGRTGGASRVHKSVNGNSDASKRKSEERGGQLITDSGSLLEGGFLGHWAGTQHSQGRGAARKLCVQAPHWRP